jgi:hypothetical protein
MAHESAGRGLESGLTTGVMLHGGITVLCLDDRRWVVVVEEEDVDGSSADFRRPPPYFLWTHGGAFVMRWGSRVSSHRGRG